ncbi:MAG: hypothetical protein ACREJ2_12880 [Planctomycetota bacterium]
MSLPHHRLPLNLPHAATVADRILTALTQSVRRADPLHAVLFEQAEGLHHLLAPFRGLEVNPPAEDARRAQMAALRLARALTAEIGARGVGSNRLGQYVRNLFECLAQGEEGARQSLIAGEHHDAPQRPRVKRLPPLVPPSGVPELPAPARTPTAKAVSADPASVEPATVNPAPINVGDPAGEGELGPPLEDESEFDLPPLPPAGGRSARPPGALPGGIIHDEDDGDDWTFE